MEEEYQKVALITGCCGQSGSYLAELLLEKGYIIYGTFRRASMINTKRIDHILKHLKMRYFDIIDFSCITSILSEIVRDNKFQYLEIYNLAAMSHVKISFDLPLFTANVDAIGTLNILEAVRQLGLTKVTKIYQASTSEQFGAVKSIPQNEDTSFNPQSPYGSAKAFAHNLCDIYRNAYGMFINNYVLFNHESPRRGENFVTRKITIGISDIVNGKKEYLELGNLDALRDWGHAKDYVQAIHIGMQLPESGYYVIASGEQHSVREFIELAFKCINVTIKWRGSGVEEEGYDAETGKVYIKINPYYYRPLEVDTLLGDSTRFREKTGWKPTISFEALVKEMVEYDLQHRGEYLCRNDN